VNRAEIVSVEVGGTRFTAFERVQVRAAFKEAARSFRLEAAAESGGEVIAWQFRAGTEVAIYAGGDLMLRGFVDQYEPSISATEAKVAISGRSKAADLIDSSAVHDTGYFEGRTALEIGQAVGQGLAASFETDQPLLPVERWQVTPGESVFRAVEKIARRQGLTMTGTAEGNVRITKAGSKRHAGGLFEGRNIKEGSADHNWSNRHSKYVVRGQRPVGHGVGALELEAIARDATVGRNRPVIVIHDDDATKDEIRDRAENRRDRAAGGSLKAGILVQGFRDEAGLLWEPGRLVWTESRFLALAQDMLIESVDFALDASGSTARLGLVDPRAYGGKAGKGAKSSPAWGQDDSDAEE